MTGDLFSKTNPPISDNKMSEKESLPNHIEPAFDNLTFEVDL